ncbi:MAG: aldehyde dehydrogenase family protein [Pseudonocardiaceae bacterium]|nr:aldehyde dehydrogenase family protein [Pseudonocardiaceae bacterium]
MAIVEDRVGVQHARLHGVEQLPSRITQRLLSTLAGHVVSSTPRAATTTAVYTGGSLADMPQSATDDVAHAVRVARGVQPGWAGTDIGERVQVLRRFHDLLLEHQDTVVDLIQAETGKARRHAFDECLEPALTTGYYLRKGAKALRSRRLEGMMPFLVGARQHRQPKGVVGIISPWNYPFALAISDVVPALLAGNAVVLKPDTQTSLSPLFGVELLRRAGVPEGVVQVVLGEGPVVGTSVVENVDYVCFTGSTRTGRDVAQRAGARLIGCSLELGGKNPMLVLDDADLDRAARAAVSACFTNAGQVCLCAERLYVHESVRAAFLDRFLARIGKLRLAASYEYDADIGSLTSARQLQAVSRFVDDAKSKGATVLTGGRARPDIGPYFYEPTVLTGVTKNMACFAEETFGPVVAVYSFTSDDDALAMANASEYGLNGCVFTRDVRRGRHVGSRLRVGSVNINDGFAAAYGSTDAPMGGMGSSGLGRRHGVEGIQKYTETQAIATQRAGLFPPPRWMPYRPFARAVTATLRGLRKAGIR